MSRIQLVQIVPTVQKNMPKYGFCACFTLPRKDYITTAKRTLCILHPCPVRCDKSCLFGPGVNFQHGSHKRIAQSTL